MSPYTSWPFVVIVMRGGIFAAWLLPPNELSILPTGAVKPMLGLGVGDSGWRLSGFVNDGDLVVCSGSLP